MRVKFLMSMSCLLVGSILFMSGLFSTPVQAETKILFNIYYSQKHPLMRGTAKPWAAAVAKATQGRYKVHFPAATLASPRKQWGMLTGGIADATTGSISWIRKRVPLTEIAALPFMALSAKGASVALWKTQQKFFAPKNEFKGVKLLSMFGTSGSQLHNNKRPIHSIADFKSLKIRASGSGVAVFKALNAVPVKLSGPKIFENFSKGVVDGVATPYVAVGAFKIIKYVKHTTDVPGSFYSSIFYVAMNQAKWDAISAADKKAIESVSGEWLARTSGTVWDKGAAGVIKKLKKNGVDIHHASPKFVSALRKRLAFVEQGWVKIAAKKGVDGKAALAYFRDQMKQNR
jgi:TRAP-type transport system periplasmic protein